jgi:hypothetical protein
MLSSLSCLSRVAPVTTATPSPPAGGTTGRDWSFSASAFTYFVPDQHDFVQPTFTADRGRLHLQVRYNYENQETGSAWIGCNFHFGSKVEFELTPALGGVFGATDGIAPGWSFSLSYWRLGLYSESEYVFDLGSSPDSFFYTWSELTISPKEWLRAGLAAQRTRAYQTDVDVQRGFVLGVSFKNLEVTSYVFNLDRDKQTYIFSLNVSF